MNTTLATAILPIAPGTLVVADHYEGNEAGVHIILCENPGHASREVESSLRDIRMYADMDPMTFDLNYNCTELVSVETFYC